MNIVKSCTLLLFLTLVTFLQTRADVLSDFTESRAINAPKTSVLIVDLENGRELMSHNADLPLIPASIMKCVTTATLLNKVGHDFRYETPVYVTGKVKDGVLDGDILIVASGDPSVNSRKEPASPDIVEEIAGRLKEMGVHTVRGSIIVDERDFPGPAINPTWASGDLPHSYGTGSHGFNFEDNASGKRSVAEPSNVFKTRLRAALERSGISLLGEQTDGGRHRKIGEHRSATVDEIMRSCMMRSDNQFAEAILRTVGLKYVGDGATATGADTEIDYWRRHKVHMDGVKIVDGSGLSRSNRVTARFMADVLGQMAGNPYYASFFPLAGQEGTLKRFLAGTPLEGYIAMKTGSMNSIQCYAGYKLDADYAPTHIIVVMMNEMANRGAARAELQKLLLSTFTPEAEYEEE